MHKINWIGILLMIVWSGCGISRQSRQIKALEDCTYRVAGISELRVAGADVRRLIAENNLSISDLPGLAVGLLTRNVPLNATVQLEIQNSSSETAAISDFDYIVLLNDQEMVTGRVDQPFSLRPGERIVVPVNLRANIYEFVADNNVLSKAIQGIKQRRAEQSLARVTIKLKPTLRLAGASVKYPGYINIQKDITLETFNKIKF